VQHDRRAIAGPFANRVLCAAARQAERYLTRARLLLPAELVVVVGEYDSRASKWSG
jgi:hypothetical protein